MVTPNFEIVPVLTHAKHALHPRRQPRQLRRGAECAAATHLGSRYLRALAASRSART